MGKFPASVEAYGKPGGGTWAGGDRLVLKDLGKTLRAIATDGPDAFYKGWIADRIAEDMAANGGLITKEDLAAYEAKERAPVKGTFRGYEIVVDAAAELRRRRADRDAEHARGVRPEGEGLRLRRSEAPRDRSDAPRLPRSRALPRRSRLRRRCR